MDNGPQELAAETQDAAADGVDMAELVVVWGQGGDDDVSAVRLADLFVADLPADVHYPIAVEAGCVSIYADYDSPVAPLEICTAAFCLSRYGAAPERGKVLTGLHEKE